MLPPGASQEARSHGHLEEPKKCRRRRIKGSFGVALCCLKDILLLLLLPLGDHVHHALEAEGPGRYLAPAERSLRPRSVSSGPHIRSLLWSELVCAGRICGWDEEDHDVLAVLESKPWSGGRGRLCVGRALAMYVGEPVAALKIRAR